MSRICCCGLSLSLCGFILLLGTGCDSVPAALLTNTSVTGDLGGIDNPDGSNTVGGNSVGENIVETGDGTGAIPGNSIDDDGDAVATTDDPESDADQAEDVEETIDQQDSTETIDALVDLPDSDYCSGVEDWPADHVQFEEEVLVLVNQERASGADCGSRGTFPAAGPLVMNGALTCAARAHSLDMFENNYFDHTNLSGQSPGDRVDLTEYQWSTWGENIAFGQSTPEQVVQAWMNSDGHCANIMNDSFTEIGIGLADGNHWTQVFGAPR